MMKSPGNARMLLAAIGLCAWGLAGSPSAGQPGQGAATQPASVWAGLKDKQAQAEEALRQCELERSLKLWREVLAEEPGHERARFVVQRLTLQGLELDRQLQLIETLIEKNVAEDIPALLDAAALRAANDSQKARILYLRGLKHLMCEEDEAMRAAFESALSLYGDTPWAGKSAIRLAWAMTLMGAENGFHNQATAAPPDESDDASPTKIEPLGEPEHVHAPDASQPSTRPIRPSPPLAPDADARARRLWPDPLQAAAEARRLLRSVIDNPVLDAPIRQEALFTLTRVETADATVAQQLAALRGLLKDLTDAGVRRSVLAEIVNLEWARQEQWRPEAIEAAAEFLATDPPYAEAADMMDRLAVAARQTQDGDTLERLAACLTDFRPRQAVLVREAGFLAAEAMASQAVVAPDLATMKKALAASAKRLEALAATAQPGEQRRLWELRGRLMLVEAQKLLALAGPGEALPAIVKAKDHYLASLPADPGACLDRLTRIVSLLEHARQHEAALALCRELADRFPHLSQGRDALMKVAQLYEGPLKAPMAALETYAEYASRYPAELPYRQLSIGRRLARLGYGNVLDFQKRNGLKPDGLAGPATREKLEQLEADFVMIRAGADPAGDFVLRGLFVHPCIFRIARRLQQAGRDHDAIAAYLMMRDLFPHKKESDDSLLAAARLFRDNMLFEEALGAYAELMEYLPDGDVTSEAYVESASCLENLSRWTQARQMYELYLKKFPKYKHAQTCRDRIAMLGEIMQYEDFLAANAASAKAPEARYQLAAILYKRMANPTKAAIEFTKVADAYPRHVRAADGLFSAGTAYLKCENFPAAREVFLRLVRGYGDSRLADDAQFWIGHTYEYSARALGRLDESRVVLKRRSLQQRADLLADLELRRRYYTQAQAGPEAPEDVWAVDALGVLTSGSRRDRVNAELMRAIAAYRKVADEFKMGDMAGAALGRVAAIYTDYLNDPEKGFQAYQELLAHYGGTKEAVDALYEVGNYYLKSKRYEEAVKACQQFIYNYPNDGRAEDAMISIAQCHLEQKAWDKALDAYQSYLSKYPQGKHAEKANAQIAWIRTYYY